MKGLLARRAAPPTNNWMVGGEDHRGSIGPELGIGGMLEQHSPARARFWFRSFFGFTLGFWFSTPGRFRLGAAQPSEGHIW